MLRKRPKVSRYYLRCPLRYLKTVLILPWIYCILDKADGLHHHGWIHISRVAVPEAKTYVFLFCFVLCVCFLSFHNRWMFNILRPRQNGSRIADDILDCVLLNENVWISIKISLKFLPKGPINNIPALVPIMTWRRPGDKPLSGRIYAPLGLNELKIWIIIFFLHFLHWYIPFLCTCTGGVCIHFYHSIHIFVYYIAILPLVTITLQNTTYWTLSC